MATVGQFLYPGSGIEVLEEEYDENFEPTQKGNCKYAFFVYSLLVAKVTKQQYGVHSNGQVS